MFSGAPLHKQLKAAILEGNEAKAIEIYKSKELGKTLITTLHPSKPFPSKKNPNGETPMELTSVAALNELFSMFLQFGGRPDIKNSRQESCIHIVCNYLSSATKRSELVEQILKWRSMNPTTKTLVAVGIDDENIDGNTALHLAAKNSLQLCICKLLAAGANLGVLNHENLTAAEFADIMGRETFGSMLELAWLYRNYSKIPLQLNADYTMLCKDRNANTVYVDSDSMTVASFSKFICRLVAFISETTGESPARSEVMLVHYSWDAHLLLKDFEASKQTVFQSVSILPTSEQEYRVSISKVAAPEQALVVRTADNVPVGIPIEEVYMDPSYSTLGPFAIFRGGKKVNYSIRTVNGKAVVVPLDFDPDAKLLMNDDQRVSANSHIKPETTTNCPMCGELMYEPASVQHFLSGDLVEPKHRELSCGSGHKYCNSCWSEYLEAHVTGDEGLDCLQCPAFKCGDMLDLQWAPVLLSSTDLVNRLLAQRQRRVISLVQLQWCPAPKCGLLVHVHKNSPESPVSGDACLSGNIPQCGVCANGHGFCLVCGKEAHSPCTCAEVEQWEGLMRSISKFADPKDSNNAANILRAAPLKKKCAHCGYLNSKFDGSNRCRCTSCHKEYCWTCQQDWEKHLDSDKSDFHCNKFISLQLAPGASEEMNGENSFLADAKTKLFIRHFSRYQTHMDSFKLESIVYRETVSRVMGALQATKGGELFWLSEEDPMPRSGNAECEDTVLAGYYLPKDEVLEFLHGAFKELEKSRLFLRWSYAFSMFNIKGEGAKIKRKFEEKQEALEKNTEALSSLISHRRLRGSKADILAATVATRRQRMASEQLVVEHSSPGGAAGTKSMKQMTMASAGSQGMNEMKMAAASSNSMIERPDASASSQGMMQMAVPQVMVPAGPPGMKQMTVATPVSGNVSSMRQQAAASESSAPPVSARRENSATEESKPRNGSASMQFSTIHEGNEEASKYTASASMTEQSQTMQQTAIVERGVTTTTTSTPAPRFNAESRSRSFNRIDKLSPLGKQQAPAGESGSSKLSRNASFRTGRVVEYISEEEAVLVYAIMKENNVSRDKAVQMFLNDHDTRLYNPKAVYLFPGEVYTEELEKAAEEEVQIQTNFGRVEYNQRKEQEIEITQTVVESDDESYMEQRLIGAKKDPDQEALEHAMLLSAQEDEFGINMYDSLSPADEIVLADYMSQGFTRSEGALIIFEEKFGKVSSFRNTSLIPAMPTLHAVHEAIADDDPEVVDLILRGYTCEQAVAVIMQHRERTRAAAAAPDPAHYEPHPDEERFQLTEKEERDVQANMDRSGLSRRDSVMMVVQTRSSSSSAQSRTSREEVSSYDDSYELRSYMDRGYTRDQAQQMIRRQSAGGNSNQGSYSGSDSVQYRNNTNSTSFYSQQNSFSSGAVSGGGDDSDVLMYMDRGYTREQAMQLVRRNPRGGQSASRPTTIDEADRDGPGSYQSSSYPVRSASANLDPQTAAIVEQQNADFGTNMYAALTPADASEVQRLRQQCGYQHSEALQEVFSRRHPPRSMGQYTQNEARNQYSSQSFIEPPVQSTYPQSRPQSLYQQSPPQSQSLYQQSPPQSFYQQSPPQSQSLYQQSPPQSFYQQSPPQSQSLYQQSSPQSFYQQSPPQSQSFHEQSPPQSFYGGASTGEPYDQNSQQYPTATASATARASIGDSVTGSVGNDANPASKGVGPPVLNGGQQSILQQKRQEEAERGAPVHVAQAVPYHEKDDHAPLEKKDKRKSFFKANSFFGGASRKHALNEDDILARAHHMSHLESSEPQKDGVKSSTHDKSAMPKLKYNQRDVDKIVAMGFSHDQAVQALIENHQDLPAAIHALA